MSKKNRGKQLLSRFIKRADYNTKEDFEREIKRTILGHKHKYPEAEIVVVRNRAGAGINAFEKLN